MHLHLRHMAKNAAHTIRRRSKQPMTPSVCACMHDAHPWFMHAAPCVAPWVGTARVTRICWTTALKRFQQAHWTGQVQTLEFLPLYSQQCNSESLLLSFRKRFSICSSSQFTDQLVISFHRDPCDLDLSWGPEVRDRSFTNVYPAACFIDVLGSAHPKPSKSRVLACATWCSLRALAHPADGGRQRRRR